MWGVHGAWRVVGSQCIWSLSHMHPIPAQRPAMQTTGRPSGPPQTQKVVLPARIVIATHRLHICSVLRGVTTRIP